MNNLKVEKEIFKVGPRQGSHNNLSSAKNLAENSISTPINLPMETIPRRKSEIQLNGSFNKLTDKTGLVGLSSSNMNEKIKLEDKKENKLILKSNQTLDESKVLKERDHQSISSLNKKEMEVVPAVANRKKIAKPYKNQRATIGSYEYFSVSGENAEHLSNKDVVKNNRLSFGVIPGGTPMLPLPNGAVKSRETLSEAEKKSSDLSLKSKELVPETKEVKSKEIDTTELKAEKPLNPASRPRKLSAAANFPEKPAINHSQPVKIEPVAKQVDTQAENEENEHFFKNLKRRLSKSNSVIAKDADIKFVEAAKVDQTQVPSIQITTAPQTGGIGRLRAGSNGAQQVLEKVRSRSNSKNENEILSDLQKVEDKNSNSKNSNSVQSATQAPDASRVKLSGSVKSESKSSEETKKEPGSIFSKSSIFNKKEEKKDVKKESESSPQITKGSNSQVSGTMESKSDKKQPELKISKDEVKIPQQTKIETQPIKAVEQNKLPEVAKEEVKVAPWQLEMLAKKNKK
eukprot:NODE_57_length_28844_cov_0.352687.p6 type:complete len:516 gc:universal NODE_57_length_28844_cov_0.352687:18306-16759(-)